MPQIAVALLFPLLYWGMVLANVFRVKRETGKRPRLSPEKLEERPLRFGWHLVIASLFGQPLLLLMGVEPWEFFRPVQILNSIGCLFFGALLGVSGLIGTWWCHQAMGHHWNMWIDLEKRSPIVDQGPYRWIRHPIYTFQIIISVGVWLLVPTPFLGGIVLLHFVCIWVKSSGEETHLLEVHGEAYRDYQSRTGRFFPMF